jgi:hypothetical protein
VASTASRLLRVQTFATKYMVLFRHRTLQTRNDPPANRPGKASKTPFEASEHDIVAGL